MSSASELGRKSDEDSEDGDDSVIMNTRIEQTGPSKQHWRLEQLQTADTELYPAYQKSEFYMPLKSFLNKYRDVVNLSDRLRQQPGKSSQKEQLGPEEKQRCEEIKKDTVELTGRVMNTPKVYSSSLTFFCISSGDETVHVKRFGKGPKLPPLRKGDIVSVTGHPELNMSNQFNLKIGEYKILSPCMREIPVQYTENALRYHNRSLDMLVNPSVREAVVARSKLMREMRAFFYERDFVEVETPILNSEFGGASADPFVTHYKSMGEDMFLRVAPELYLKRLVVGGLERVFEIGKVFRNEHVDRSHVPEFSTCEFYEAYSNCDELMKTTQELLKRCVFAVKGSHTVLLEDSNVVIDFSKPFRRIDVVPFLEEKLQVTFPDPKEPAKAVFFLTELFMELGIPVTQSSSSAEEVAGEMIEELIERFIEPECIQPTFVCGQPIATSPLAKARPDGKAADRFELFINKTELCNAYSELNDPAEQRKRFVMQQNACVGEVTGHEDVLKEALGPSENEYCSSLELGLPPTGGWGMGIDRLLMLMTGTSAIREVLAFPKARTDKQK
eukprot:Nk52_evm23s621 gene=Nk52_evmTU23s621